MATQQEQNQPDPQRETKVAPVLSTEPLSLIRSVRRDVSAHGATLSDMPIRYEVPVYYDGEVASFEEFGGDLSEDDADARDADITALQQSVQAHRDGIPDYVRKPQQVVPIDTFLEGVQGIDSSV